MRWLITNRNIEIDATGAPAALGTDFADLTYWTLKQPDLPLTALTSWQLQDAAAFQKMLVQAANQFPSPVGLPSAQQKHVCLFIHGFNTKWTDAMNVYANVASRLFDGPNSLGELISFDWPSRGSLTGYLPDRAEARQTGDDLTQVLSELYDWMSGKQVQAANDPATACKAKTSIIAHSMGNYALEYAMNAVWTRKNRPLLVSLMQEVLMVAGDVDNDLFGAGETVTEGNGEGLANLSYRITALFTGRDDVLGASAGLKHFGKRRLGRAGLDRTVPAPDNVWDIDCTKILSPAVNGIDIHGQYFALSESVCYDLMRNILEGVDRSLLIQSELVPPALPRVQPASA